MTSRLRSALPTYWGRWYTDTPPLPLTVRITPASARPCGARSRSQRIGSSGRAYARPEYSNSGNPSSRLRPARFGYSSRWMRSASSRLACNCAGVSQLRGSPQRLPVPCDRSTTPLSWGWRGGLACTATARPASHNTRSVGRSPRDPQGEPLSTRSLPGRPQRVNCPRRNSCVAPGGTLFQYRWGENLGRQDGARGLIDGPHPAHLLAAGQGDLIGGVELPDLMGPSGPTGARAVAAPRRGGI